MQRLARQGVSTIVGAVIFLLIAIAVLVTMILIFNSAMSTVEKVTRLALTRASEASLANAISGWWILEGTNLVINITNNAPRTIEIDAVAIVLSNGSYIALYPGHTLGSTITVVKPDGTITVASLSLPFYLGTGYTINITVPNIVNAQPKSVSIALSMSPIVLSISLRPYVPTAQITVKPQVYMSELNRYNGLGTIALLKTMYAAAYSNIFGTITNLSISAQSYNGTTTDLEYIDSRYLNASALLVPPNIILLSRNAKVYTNFSTNPFTMPTTSPQYLINYSSASYASWYWGSYGYTDGGILYNSSLSYTFLFGYVLSSQNLAVGLAYNNYSIMPSNENWSISTKIYVPSISSTNFTTRGSLSYALYVFEGAAFVQNESFYYGAGILAVYNSTSRSTTYAIAIENSTSQGIMITIGNTLSITPGWYIIYAEYNPLKHSLSVELLNLSGVTIATYSFVDTSTTKPNPVYAGVTALQYLNASSTSLLASISCSPQSLFDDLIAGPGNITTITITDIPNGYTVEIMNSSGEVISSTTSINGIANINVIINPIIHNGTIIVINTNGVVQLSKSFSLILGGDTYQYLPSRYQVEVSIDTHIDLRNVINDTHYWNLYAPLYLSTNDTYVNVSLYAYNLQLDEYINVFNSINTLSLSTNISLSPPALYLNTSSGNVKIILVIYSNNPFNISLNTLNAFLNALTEGTKAPLLLVGTGNSNYIDVYQVSITTTGPQVKYLYSIDSHTTFNGKVSIASDDERLYLINSSGIYYTYVIPNANFTLLTSACRATGVGAQLTALNLSGITYLIALPGNGNNTLCVVNVSNGVVTTLNLGSAQGYNYSVSAYNSSCAWFVVNASGYPELIQVCGSSFTVTPLLNLTTTKNVGLAYCGSLNELVMLSEGGPSYVIDLLTKSLTRDGSLPFYPVGLGDRLGCYNGYAFFVRADETNELWVWKVSG